MAWDLTLAKQRIRTINIAHHSSSLDNKKPSKLNVIFDYSLELPVVSTASFQTKCLDNYYTGLCLMFIILIKLSDYS